MHNRRGNVLFSQTGDGGGRTLLRGLIVLFDFFSVAKVAMMDVNQRGCRMGMWMKRFCGIMII